MRSTILDCAKVCLLIALLAGTTFGAGYDLIQDGSIDWADVGAFAEKWLADCSVVDCEGANFYHTNNIVDLADFTLFINHWRATSESADPNLLAFWEFEGNYNDTSGYGSPADGAALGDAVIVSDPERGSVLNVGASGGGSVNCGNPAKLNFRDPFTIAAWIKTTDADGIYSSIATKGEYGAYRIGLSTSDRTYTYLETNGGSNTATINGGSMLNDGQWHHVAAVYDGTYLHAIVDAGVTYNGLWSISGPTEGVSAYDFMIGNNALGEKFIGQIDNVCVFDRALDTAELLALSNYKSNIASDLSPENDTECMPFDTTLSWTAGEGILYHDVYLGTNPTPGAAEYKGIQMSTSYDPGLLAANATYYWRIDEVSTFGTSIGGVQNFATSTAMAESAYYIATDGSDSDPGTQALPFATLEKARDTISCLALPDGGITIYLRGGKYFRTSEFTLVANDSGTADKPVVYMAYPGEDVRIIGGVELDHSDFSLVTDPAILGRMEAVADGNVYECNLTDLGITNLGQLRTRGTCMDYISDWIWQDDDRIYNEQVRSHMELSFNEDMMELARWPNDDYAHTVESIDNVPTFVYDGSRPERWASATNPWATGYWRFGWSDWYEAIEDIDTVAKTITITDSVATAGMCQLILNPSDGVWNRLEGKAWYALNLLEEIDSAGEFYVEYEAGDHYNGMLYIWPPTNDINGADEIIVSTLGENQECLVSTYDVSYVTFSGITFEMNRHNVFEISDGNSVLVDDCVIRNTGSHAIFILSGVNHGVQNSEIYNTGGMGIRILGGDRDSLTAANNFATNNHIHDFARWERGYRPAVALEGCGNQATYNWIHDAPHKAIYFVGNDHDIKYNKIHNVVQISSDAGAIYSWMDWSFRGNKISYNLIYDIHGFLTEDPNYGNGIRAIYLDGYFAAADVFGNIISDIGGDGIFHQGGQDNNFQNNIIVKCDTNFFMTGGPGATKACSMLDSLKAFDYQNPPWSTKYPFAAAVPSSCTDPAFAPYAYTIYSEFNKNLSWDNGVWIASYGLGVWDNHQIEDNRENMNPRFYDEAGGVLAVHDDSPVYEIPGFVRVPWELMGNLDLDLATRPVPPDDGADVVMDPNLYWAPAFDANLHTVYFGATFADVNTRAAGANKGQFSDSHYAPGQLLAGTTYYWAIDGEDVDGDPLGSGDVWSFTVRDIKAVNPIPSNGEVLVNESRSATLRWQCGYGAERRDIYFGIDSTPDAGELVSDDTTAMSYDASGLTENTVYYWRIDSNDSGTVTTGDLWSFTTGYDLAGQWQFENNYNDSSAYGNDGTAYGDATIVNDGSRGYVLSCDGVGDWVEIPNESAFDVSRVTLMAWVKTTDSGIFRTIANKGQVGWRVTKSQYGKAWTSIALNDGSNTQVGGGTLLNDGVWHHVAISYDGVSRRIYVDGGQDGSSSNSTATLYTNNNSLLIGDNGVWYANQCWNGYIDDVRVYNIALDASEILNIYQTTSLP